MGKEKKIDCYLHEVNNKVDELVPQHDLRVEVGDQEADVIALHKMTITDHIW